jgi:hypothetical protein
VSSGAEAQEGDEVKEGEKVKVIEEAEEYRLPPLVAGSPVFSSCRMRPELR